jgi:hypothetical protein
LDPSGIKLSGRFGFLKRLSFGLDVALFTVAGLYGQGTLSLPYL